MKNLNAPEFWDEQFTEEYEQWYRAGVTASGGYIVISTPEKKEMLCA